MHGGVESASSRSPGYATENRVLAALAQALADSPRAILQTLVEAILKTFQVGSAGVSLLAKDAKSFYWPAIAGEWKRHIGGGTPRDFGPCGDVLDRNASLLFKHIERRYDYFLPVTPAVEEALLVPFYVAGQAVGTDLGGHPRCAPPNRRRRSAAARMSRPIRIGGVSDGRVLGCA